ncbi:Pentatricopeptide repeat-containing protein [Forsythia ovata]|uniref:Pentatricopeptide repeat-containing protein n=1 Tax=Forsythia ovata TaxID=205694 RepID=A0ABD1X426_9LAMI
MGKQLDYAAPMTAAEYAKGICVATTLKSIDLAVELFAEAGNKQLKETSIYNALMSVYIFNGLAMKCQSLLQDLKGESTCSPTIVTYNILILGLGHLMLIDHMETALGEIMDLNLSPYVVKYNI